MTINPIPIVNLYNEDGIAIYLNASHDIVDPTDNVDADPEFAHLDRAVVCVVGHRGYASSLEEAEHSICQAYLNRIGA